MTLFIIELDYTILFYLFKNIFIHNIFIYLKKKKNETIVEFRHLKALLMETFTNHDNYNRNYSKFIFT